MTDSEMREQSIVVDGMRIRFDYPRQLRNDDDLVLCSVCGLPIPDDAVPLMLWAEDPRWMATICDDDFADVAKKMLRNG
jgi:hypothetical protein